MDPVGTDHQDAWLAHLQRRFVEIARRRVPVDAAEDVAQDAMRVVLEKGLRPGEDSPDPELPPLAWCFQVLRNAVGNFYQKQRTLARNTELDHASGLSDGPTPLEALEQTELHRLVGEVLQEMDRAGDACGGYLRELAEGNAPADMAARDGIDAAVLYRRLYRCRGKLRTILEQRGVLT